jgi:hypothetical protein
MLLLSLRPCNAPVWGQLGITLQRVGWVGQDSLVSAQEAVLIFLVAAVTRIGWLFEADGQQTSSPKKVLLGRLTPSLAVFPGAHYPG